MLRRSLTTCAFALALAVIAAPATAATTYQTVTLTVPVTIDQMPLGTTAYVACYTPTVGSATSYAQTNVPVETQNGFVVYHGPAIVVVLKNGQTGNGVAGSTGTSLVSGANIGCALKWSPGSPTDSTKSTYTTYSVQLQ
jgi:hypothetical protein